MQYSIDYITYKKLCDIPLLNVESLAAIQRLYDFNGSFQDAQLAIDLLDSIGEFMIADNLKKVVIWDIQAQSGGRTA